MKICAISDIHGYLPDIPDCDLLLIAGDICPLRGRDIYFQYNWLITNFQNWLLDVPASLGVIGIAGNHDFVFQDPIMGQQLKSLTWHYLQDQYITIANLKIYGTPWSPIFYHWAFNASEEDQERIFGKIPEGVDILISHCPPFGIMDLTPNNESVGSQPLMQVVDNVKPKHHIFGHIHSGYGQYANDYTKFHNVSICNDPPINEPMRPVNPPTIIEI